MRKFLSSFLIAALVTAVLLIASCNSATTTTTTTTTTISPTMTTTTTTISLTTTTTTTTTTISPTTITTTTTSPTTTTTTTTAPIGDYGDAPDGVVTGYPLPFAQIGSFPTLSASGGAHTLSISEATLGPNASMEVDATDPADPDGVPNLTNTDSDNGINNFFVALTAIPPPTELTVQINGTPGGAFFINVLIDLDMDGEWSGTGANGEPEWVAQNFPVSVSPGENIVPLPPFAFANGNRLPDGAWMRIALTKEMVSGTDWDGTGSFSSGEVEDHVISLPLVGGKRIPALVVTNDGPYPIPGATGRVFCIITVRNLGAAGSFNWSLTPLTGDVDVAPTPGPIGPVNIAAAGDPLDVVKITVTALGGTKNSSWLFTAVTLDPPAKVSDVGVSIGYSGESTTTLEFIPMTWDVFIAGIEGSFEHFTDISILTVYIDVFGNNQGPMLGAMVTVQMTRPDGTTYTKEEFTDENGQATVNFDIFVYGTYTITILDIQGDNMKYTPENNVVSEVEIVVE